MSRRKPFEIDYMESISPQNLKYMSDRKGAMTRPTEALFIPAVSSG
jgi:hypothetical protein